MDVSMLTNMAMTTSTTSTTGLLHGHPALDMRTSPIGFEATMSVAMELENKLKAEADGRSVVDESIVTGNLTSPLIDGARESRSRSSSPVTTTHVRPPSSHRGHHSNEEDDYDYDDGDLERRKSGGLLDDDVGDCANSDVDGQLSGEDDMDMDDVSSCSPLPPTADTTRSEEDEDALGRIRHSEDGHAYDYRPQPLDGSIGGKDGGANNNGEQRTGGHVYQCHVCNFTGPSKFHFNSHMNTHYARKCELCDYTSRTEGRLKRHVRDFHSDTALTLGDGASRPLRVGNTPNKLKTYKCKQCSFVATAKTDFWEHSKTHIKAEKLLTCPKCPFVTEYKHHLEYHLRNHFGSKPFKCPKCNYSCVNKSMLNSHMKSHSNIYQYRCSDCAYATKYCHSLKLHLRKYGHKPSTVLNADGTPNPMPVIDVYGSRRGPRIRKNHEDLVSGFSPFGPLQLSLNGGGITPTSASAAATGLPTYLFPANVNVLNGFHGMGFSKGFSRDVKEELADNGRYPPGGGGGGGGHPGDMMRCTLCEFVTDVRETFTKHMLLHAAAENQDLCNLYGFNSEALMQEQQQISGTNRPSSVPSLHQQPSPHHQTNSPLCQSAQMQLSPHQRVPPLAPPPPIAQAPPQSSELLGLPTTHHPVGCHTRHATPENHTTYKQENGASIRPPQMPPKFHHQQMQAHVAHPLEHLRMFSENLSVRSMFVKELLPHSFASFSPIAGALMSSGMQPVMVPESAQIPMTSSFSAVSLATCNSSPTMTTATPRGNGVHHVPTNVAGSAVKVEDRGTPQRQGQAQRQGQLGQTPLDLSSSKENSSRPLKDPGTACSSSLYSPPQQLLHRASASPPMSPPPAATTQVVASTVSPPSKHRRKGKAFKLDRICMKLKEKFTASSPSDAGGEGGGSRFSHGGAADVEDAGFTDKEQDSNDSGDRDRDREVDGPNGDSCWKSSMPVPQMAAKLLAGDATAAERVNGRSHRHTLAASRSGSGNVAMDLEEHQNWKEAYECQYCDMAFKDCVMYTVHMGYHGFKDPFKCNMCGHQAKDKVAFFLHIARTAHL